MFLQGDNYSFSAPVVFCGTTQCADNGYPINKHCNTAAECYGRALRVNLSSPMDIVTPLGKGIAISFEACLVMNNDKLTELVILTLKGH